MLESASLSDVGSVRPNNEDFCKLFPELGLFILADGMGGARGGEFASRLAVDTVAELMRAAPVRDAATLLRAIEDANHRVYEEAAEKPELEGMGTTLVAAMAVNRLDQDGKGGQQIAIASVGDSRAYIYEGGALRAVTEDQTWVEEVGRPMGLDDESLRRHPMRHVLTMAIGVSMPLSIRYYSIRLHHGDMLLLSSDGLHGVLETGQISAILGDPAKSLSQKCEALVCATHEAGAPDNVTVVIIRAK
jgi:PPM family protein phosphatase